jgi:hypothetical protein
LLNAVSHAFFALEMPNAHDHEVVRRDDEHRLPAGAGLDGEADQFSADGRWLAYVSNDSSLTEDHLNDDPPDPSRLRLGEQPSS